MFTWNSRFSGGKGLVKRSEQHLKKRKSFIFLNEESLWIIKLSKKVTASGLLKRHQVYLEKGMETNARRSKHYNPVLDIELKIIGPAPELRTRKSRPWGFQQGISTVNVILPDSLLMEWCILASLNKYSHLLRLTLLEMILRELMNHIKATLLQGCKPLNQDAGMPLHLSALQYICWGQEENNRVYLWLWTVGNTGTWENSMALAVC